MFRMRQSVYTLPASNIKQATEKMWNNPKPFSLFLIVSFLIASLCSCNADDTGGKDVTPPDTTNVVPTAKTVLIYMAAQNSLGARRNQQADSLEIMQAYKDIPGDARILLFIDDKYAPRIYRIDKTTPRPVMVKRWQNDEDSASPAFLGELLSFIKRFYPSDEYGMVLWSHATGWVPPSLALTRNAKRLHAKPLSFGIDDGEDFGSDNGSEMEIRDMAVVMKKAGFHARYIFFDACLMQNIEVVYELRHAADYIVGAPISTPGAGANYTNQIRKGLFDDDVRNIASTYLSDVCDPSQAEDYSDFGLVISVVKTSELDKLVALLRDRLPHSALAGKTSPDMESVLSYQAYSRRFYYRPHNYDMAESMRHLLNKDDATAIIDQLDKAIIYKGATRSFWIGPGDWSFQTVDPNLYSGISMFIPQNVYTYNAEACSAYGDLNLQFKKTNWYVDAGWKETGW